jgi:hypothetical protein
MAHKSIFATPAAGFATILLIDVRLHDQNKLIAVFIAFSAVAAPSYVFLP